MTMSMNIAIRLGVLRDIKADVNIKSRSASEL
jgi:hypothetical protein